MEFQLDPRGGSTHLRRTFWTGNIGTVIRSTEPEIEPETETDTDTPASVSSVAAAEL